MSVQELLESNHSVNMNVESSADKGSTSSRGELEIFIGQMSKIFNSGGQALADRLFKQMKWTGKSMYGMMGRQKQEPFNSNMEGNKESPFSNEVYFGDSIEDLD